MSDSANCSSNGYVLPDKLNTESLFWKPLSPKPQLLHGLPFLFWYLYNFLMLTAPSSFLVASASNRQAILEQKILRELFKHFGSIFSFPLLSQAHVDQTFVLLTAHKSVFFNSPMNYPWKNRIGQSWHHSCFLFDIVYHCFLLFFKKDLFHMYMPECMYI